MGQDKFQGPPGPNAQGENYDEVITVSSRQKLIPYNIMCDCLKVRNLFFAKSYSLMDASF